MYDKRINSGVLINEKLYIAKQMILENSMFYAQHTFQMKTLVGCPFARYFLGLSRII